MPDASWGGAGAAPGLPWAGLSPALVWKNGAVYLAKGEPLPLPALCCLAFLVSYLTLHLSELPALGRAGNTHSANPGL